MLYHAPKGVHSIPGLQMQMFHSIGSMLFPQSYLLLRYDQHLLDCFPYILGFKCYGCFFYICWWKSSPTHPLLRLRGLILINVHVLLKSVVEL